jgi:hypothetical protein
MGAHVLVTALKLGCKEAHRFTVHVAIRCVALPEKGKPCARMRAADVRPSLLRRRAAGARAGPLMRHHFFCPCRTVWARNVNVANRISGETKAKEK